MGHAIRNWYALLGPDVSFQTSRFISCIEIVSCSHYLCPKTLDCVQSPALCPCPFPEDIRCVVPDMQDKDAATILCVRGDSECKEIERLAGLSS